MGFNTVVLVLNDFTHELSKSPHTLTWAICHPPNNDSEEYLNKIWWPQVTSVAEQHGESINNLRSALTVLPAFHADDKHVLIAGWNSLSRPKYEDYKVNKDRTKITINLPEWWKR